MAVDRATANRDGGKIERRKFPQKVIVWLEVCSKDMTPLLIFDKGSVDHDRYIREILPVAADYGNQMFWQQLDLSTRRCETPHASFVPTMVPGQHSVVFLPELLASEQFRFEPTGLLNLERAS
jgi:hypothetical protein